ncbi:sensor domain-containing diguanylate cyclase [Photobacterium profundum]|uniref:sensor domain-containing diguanylate cyclase n=1 Tax=Photobacterium profundum TaxID=74109 RepID=UPI003D1414ED
MNCSRRFILLILFFSPSACWALISSADFDSPILMFTAVILAISIGGAFLALILHNVRLSSFKKIQANLNYLPVGAVIVRGNDGSLLYANKACRELIGVRKVGNSYIYPDHIEPQMLYDFLRPYSNETGFRDWGKELILSEHLGTKLKVSGQRIRFKRKMAWLLYLYEPQQHNVVQSKIEQEQRVFQSVLNSLSELVYFQDNADRIIGTNKAFDRFWRGRLNDGLIDSEDASFSSNNSTHTWTTSPEGCSRLLETNKTLLIGDNSEVIGTLGISHDVTDWHEMQESLKTEIEKREVTEQTLAQRNNLLDTILSASQDPIGLFNQHWVYVGCNESFAHSLGYTTETLLGKGVSDVLDSDKWELCRPIDEEVMAKGITIKTEDYVILEDGTPIWYEVAKSPYRDPTDNSVGVLVMARDVTERKATEQQLADAIMDLQELSFIDSLTKVANRRSFDEQLRKLWHGHVREQQPLTLILCDIDYFKAFNDNYGHQQGDVALQEVAKVLRNVVQRGTDEVARYGGEEFAFLLPNTDLKGGEIVAANIHQELASKGLTHGYSNVANRLTVSLGIASVIPLPSQDYGDLVGMADVALYKAKAAGRNCSMSISDSDDF